MRILIVEDESKIALAIKRGLEHHKYTVEIASDGDSGLERATSGNFDLIILDRMLPGSIDGTGILKAIRDNNDNTPVLLLTAKDRVIDRAEGLNLGADDYLVKPFAFLELIARVRALLRRPKQTVNETLKYEDLVLNLGDYSVVRDGKEINLTAKEFALLEYLMRRPNQVISKEALVENVWEYDSDILPNTVEVYIGYLRSKIDKPFLGKNLINTKRGFGYVFG